ncbi:MAG: hypothetical protein ACP5XB_21970 [Isosphaeraceae bacterium]
MAKLLGKSFDQMVTQIAEGRAALINKKLNAEVVKRATVFKEYGVFCGIDYRSDQVVLHFDLTRLKSEGVVGYVFATPHHGTVPLYRWVNRRVGSHLYSTNPRGPGWPGLISEGVVCHVPDRADPGVIPLQAWHGRRDHLYTTSHDALSLARMGFRTSGLAFYVYSSPVADAVPFYRFFDPRRGLHFYTTHPHAEFVK